MTPHAQRLVSHWLGITVGLVLTLAYDLIRQHRRTQ